MRARARGFLALFIFAVGFALAGCDSVDRLQDTVTGMFDRKKKLPGHREPVFPEGVPGVIQGVPPEYLRENRPQEPDPTALAPQQPATMAPETPRVQAPAPHRQRTAKPADQSEPVVEAPKEKPRRRPRQTAQQPRSSTIPSAMPVSPGASSAPSTAPSAPAAVPAKPTQQPFPAPVRTAPLPWPTTPSQ